MSEEYSIHSFHQMDKRWHLDSVLDGSDEFKSYEKVLHNFCCWQQRGTGGGDLVELRGLSLHCLLRGESNDFQDHREAGGQPVPKKGF